MGIEDLEGRGRDGMRAVEWRREEKRGVGYAEIYRGGLGGK